ncbi:type I secretion system permease/ATPase [Caenispirillum bisanense]|uniref:ATP-binding cassette, subfamily C/ATP-binding cassette, subfamily C, EexD n=1 Tax=Caenispirillum bisanense TaxID=414052 RepID=A0A286GSY6_9PROT|nr:type I secretion system permease/ATPase [Caenispirillum bisanense]SOD98084.1 ATP-binding cassette, subfamily C/ATP-binding cassette, subfamily C, EexD [Caenispirillum bisanense]
MAARASQKTAAGETVRPPETVAARRRLLAALGIVLAFSFVIGLLMFVGPLYMLQVYDRVLSSRSLPTLGVITAAAVGALLVMAVIDALRTRILVRAAARLDADLAPRLFDAAFRAGLRHPEGNHVQALRDLDSVRDTIAGQGIAALCDLPWVPLFVAVCFLVHPWLGAAALLAAGLSVAMALANAWTTRRPQREGTRAGLTAAAQAADGARNAEVLQAMGMLSAARARWQQAHQAAVGWQARALDRSAVTMAASKSLRMMQQVLALGTGAWLALNGEISPGMMIAASIIMGRALAPIDMLVGNWRGLTAARAAWGRMDDLLRLVPAERARMALPAPTGHVSVAAMTVVPPGRTTPCLRGVTLDIPAGELLGVVGPSAAGKSSFARALVGVWPVVQGTVRLDGNEVSAWDPDVLGRSIGYLPQDVELLDGTVAETIARGGPVDADAVLAAARLAGVHGMIQGLEQGYDTRIGRDGHALSAGQRQRLALARALYGDPALVVLDEPNSNLDAEGEAALVRALQAVRRAGRTAVIVTHRTSILSAVDRILVLKGGQVEGLGTRNEILAALMPKARTAAPAGTGSGTGATAGAAPSPLWTTLGQSGS